MSVGVGLDLGSRTATVAAVRFARGGLELVHFRHYMRDELVDSAASAGPGRLATAVVHRLRQDGVRPRSIVLGVSGQDAIIRYSHLPAMPDWRLDLIMRMEIADLTERTGEPLSADFLVVPNSSGGNQVLVALAKDARVKEGVDGVEAAGGEVVGALPQPVATADAYRFLSDEADAGLSLVLDIGDRSTEVALVDEGELIFARSVARGGAAFTEAVAEALGVAPADADAILRSADPPDDVDLDAILARPRRDLVALVDASLSFARDQLRRPKLTIDRIAVAGGCARAPGLVEALGRAIGCAAAAFDPLADLQADAADRTSREQAAAWGVDGATAVGLALSAVLPGATRLNLLPLATKQRLEFRHKTVWTYVAGGLLVASLLVGFVTAGWRYAGEGSRAAALEDAQQTVARRLAAHRDRREANDRREADLRRLAQRARPGLHLATLLRALGEVTPPEVSYAEARLVPGDVEGAFRFELNGTADQGEGSGVQALRTLERALRAQTLISDARVQPQGDEDGAIRFLLIVTPTGNPAPPASDEDEG